MGHSLRAMCARNLFPVICCSTLVTFLCRRFFLAACDVPSLEDKFNVDQYSDLVTVSKPVIYISIGEMINTHTVSLDLFPSLLLRNLIPWQLFALVQASSCLTVSYFTCL